MCMVKYYVGFSERWVMKLIVSSRRRHTRYIGDLEFRRVLFRSSMQIYFEGTEHGALADARNTAKILKRLSNLQDVRERIQQSHITYNDSQSHGFTMGLVFKKK